MTLDAIKLPNFRQAQKVMFMGGEGIVRSRNHEGGRWTYVVEMALGIEPNFGRVGAETMVLLSEADVHAA